MNALLLLVLTSAGYLVAYYTYGRFISRKIFKVDPSKIVPSIELEDGQEYVPSKRGVVFGHHFTSIAGTGPIVGPAVGVIWGWVPALLWVFFGSIFIGAVHDFAALKISLRNNGRSISDISAKYISKNVRTVFFIIIFFSLMVVMAIFGLIIAVVFSRFPQSVFPVWMQIPIAVGMGHIIYKRKGNIRYLTLLSILLMYLTAIAGSYIPVSIPEIFGVPVTGVWAVILLIYAFFASVLPVTTLLQPRDYINAWQLYLILGAIITGIIVISFKTNFYIQAPAFNPDPVGAPSLWPFLFIIVACGAVSGFHSLVGSGTSAKQLCSEADAQFVGYGSMLLESLLATVMIIAVTAGLGVAYKLDNGEVLTGVDAWFRHYSSWNASSGMGDKLDAVVTGCSNILSATGVPESFAVVILGVFIASFAGTTLDSSTRIQRYIISELFSKTRFSFLANKWIATSIAVISAAILAFSSGADGTGALLLWPLLGSVNQLLASIALMVATVYLRAKGGFKYLVTLLPCIFMIIITFWGALLNQIQFVYDNTLILSAVNLIVFIFAGFIALETVYILIKTRRRKSVGGNQ
ncbi:MAG: carbon starvation protein A [bacterium]|nr:carbon starvation protein A [bacterium]